MAGEKRSSRRKSLKYPARIDAGDGSPLRDCVLSDVSETGARLVLKDDGEVPEHFTLLFGTQGAAPRSCRIAWRDGAELGLEFNKEPRSIQPPLLRSRRDR